MTSLLKNLRSLARDEEGASLAEYGLLLALIAVDCVAAVTLLGSSVSGVFTNVANTI